MAESPGRQSLRVFLALLGGMILSAGFLIAAEWHGEEHIGSSISIMTILCIAFIYGGYVAWSDKISKSCVKLVVLTVGATIPSIVLCLLSP